LVAYSIFAAGLIALPFDFTEKRHPMQIQPMNFIDFLLGLGIALSIIGGLWRGVAREAVNLAVSLAGLLIAGRLYVTVTKLIVQGFPDIPAPSLWGFLITLIVSYAILSSLIGGILRTYNWPVMGCQGEVGGGILAFITGGVVGTVLIAALLAFPLWGLEELAKQSWLAKTLIERYRIIFSLLPVEFREAITQVLAPTFTIFWS
jgi:uncharacterized membrane protein required for colicin V production